MVKRDPPLVECFSHLQKIKLTTRPEGTALAARLYKDAIRRGKLQPRHDVYPDVDLPAEDAHLEEGGNAKCKGAAGGYGHASAVRGLGAKQKRDDRRDDVDMLEPEQAVTNVSAKRLNFHDDHQQKQKQQRQPQVLAGVRQITTRSPPLIHILDEEDDDDDVYGVDIITTETAVDKPSAKRLQSMENIALNNNAFTGTGWQVNATAVQEGIRPPGQAAAEAALRRAGALGPIVIGVINTPAAAKAAVSGRAHGSNMDLKSGVAKGNGNAVLQKGVQVVELYDSDDDQQRPFLVDNTPTERNVDMPLTVHGPIMLAGGQGTDGELNKWVELAQLLVNVAVLECLYMNLCPLVGWL